MWGTPTSKIPASREVSLTRQATKSRSGLENVPVSIAPTPTPALTVRAPSNPTLTATGMAMGSVMDLVAGPRWRSAHWNPGVFCTLRFLPSQDESTRARALNASPEVTQGVCPGRGPARACPLHGDGGGIESGVAVALHPGASGADSSCSDALLLGVNRQLLRSSSPEEPFRACSVLHVSNGKPHKLLQSSWCAFLEVREHPLCLSGKR